MQGRSKSGRGSEGEKKNEQERRTRPDYQARPPSITSPADRSRLLGPICVFALAQSSPWRAAVGADRGNGAGGKKLGESLRPPPGAKRGWTSSPSHHVVRTAFCCRFVHAPPRAWGLDTEEPPSARRNQFLLEQRKCSRTSKLCARRTFELDTLLSRKGCNEQHAE